ncbi:B-box zinc finger protein [uncultured Porphyromonas sp.]
MTPTLSVHMYCYRHPDRPAVALCQDCGRALCHECESFF